MGCSTFPHSTVFFIQERELQRIDALTANEAKKTKVRTNSQSSSFI